MSATDRTQINPTETGLLAPEPAHEFCAGRLALDFCNTLSPHRPAPANDRLADGPSFAAWAKRAGWEVSEAAAAAELAAFRSLRTRLRNLFEAVVDQRVMAQADIEALDGAMIDAFSALRLRPAGDRPLAWQDGAPPIDGLRHAIVRDAVDLLTAGEPSRLRRCLGDACDWLFYDASKNGRRRWCVMEDCGTRHKVRRFRERRKVSPAS